MPGVRPFVVLLLPLPAVLPGPRAAVAPAPLTVTLEVREGWNSKDGTLAANDLVRLRASDDDRLALRDREQLHLAFDRSVPPGAIVTAVRVLVEHHEEPRVVAGEARWKIGNGTLSGPAIVATTSAPLRSGPAAEGVDSWAPATLVPDLNDLKLVVQNDSQSDDTLLDRVAVQVDYSLPDSAPVILSVPSSTAVVGVAYAYDADSRAEASGAPPLTWSVVSAPPGLSIQPGTGVVAWTPSAAGSVSISIQVANGSGTGVQQFVVQVAGEQSLPSTLAPANPVSLVYCPPERLALGPAKSQQRLNVFLPIGSPPPSGWPVVLNNRAGGGFATLALASLQDTGATAPLHAFVASGIAVVDFGVTGIGNGQGLFYPPGHPSGRYESFQPAHDNPEKDAEWALQWLKTQGLFPLDAGRICLRGSSHGAILAIWAAMGPDRRRATGSAQVRASTRVKGVLALQPPTSLWAFDQDPTFDSRLVAHFERQDRPGVPATFLGQVAESLQKAWSVMGFAFETAEARANNEAQAICLLYAEPVKRIGGAPADMSLDQRGFPRLHDVLGQPFIHDGWSGYVHFRQLLDLSAGSAAFHRASSVFAVRDTSALPPPFDWHTRTFSGSVTGAQASAIAHAWVLRTLQ